MIIKIKSFTLRPYNNSDAQDLLENFNDKEVVRFMSGVKHPYTLKDAKKWIARCKKLHRMRQKREMVWVIEKNKKLVGSIGLKKIKKHKAELGYWLGQSHWSKGIMTEAIKAVSNFAFKKLKLKRVYAYVFEKNKVSARVLEKNGFDKEGFLKKDRIKDNKFVNVYLYAKVK